MIFMQGMERGIKFSYCHCETLVETMYRAKIWPATPTNHQLLLFSLGLGRTSTYGVPSFPERFLKCPYFQSFVSYRNGTIEGFDYSNYFNTIICLF